MEPVNMPEIVAEVTQALEAYEDALVNNRVDILDELFWNSPQTVRFGTGENLYGRDEILAFRRARPLVGLRRSVTRTQITTFGRDFAVAHREFVREDSQRPGRQTQTWIRTDFGWRVASAHVSFVG